MHPTHLSSDPEVLTPGRLGVKDYEGELFDLARRGPAFRSAPRKSPLYGAARLGSTLSEGPS